ncbi:MAG: EAL domain-containing protein [Ilumatobacteraceae bacterium]
MAAAVVRVDEGPLDTRVHDAALRHVVKNASPMQVLLPLFILTVTLVMQGEADRQRLTLWVVLSFIGSLVVAVAARQFKRNSAPGHLGRLDWTLATAALASIGAVVGLSPWVAAHDERDILTIFTLFSALSVSVGGVVCAGRRDMFAAYSVPLVGLSVWGLWSSGDARMRTLAFLFVVFGASQIILHHTLSRSIRELFRHQFESARVAAQMSADREELSRAYEQLGTSNGQLAHLASHDPLTGLLNRRGTIERLNHLVSAAAADAPVALLYLDLDRFKAINDLLGHHGGDAFLSVLADRMGQTLDEPCFAGRVGGDEFVVILPGHDEDRAGRVARQLVHCLSLPVQVEGRSIPSSVSLGVALAPQHGTSGTILMRNANMALFGAKNAGRNRLEFFAAHMQAQLQAKIDQEQAFRRALDSGEIMPFFQPEIDAVTGRVVGAEILARWLLPDGTVMPANDFIALARSAGLLEHLTERVLDHARPEMHRLISIGLPAGFRFRINLGPASTDRSWRNNPIDELIRGIDPCWVTVDVREASVVNDLTMAAATLSAFRAAGGSVCLDDFVRGVSSLALLRLLPIDEVRVDREAIDGLTAHPHDRAIVRSVISVVGEIGLTVSAEGVENGAQADTLIALGCTRQQGHLYAPALPVTLFESFLLQRQADSVNAQLEPHHDWAMQEFD